MVMRFEARDLKPYADRVKAADPSSAHSNA
jgi:hypothetical protein